MERLYYTELLPIELQELLLLYIGIDTKLIDILCEELLSINLCDDDHRIWKLMFATHITSNKSISRSATRSDYEKLINDVFDRLKYTTKSEKVLTSTIKILFIDIKKYSADLLVNHLLEIYPRALHRDTKASMGYLMERYPLSDSLQIGSVIGNWDFSMGYDSIDISNHLYGFFRTIILFGG